MDDRRIEELSTEILNFSRNELLVSFRFLDLAICKLNYKRAELDLIGTDGKYLYYNPKYVFNLYKVGSEELNHVFLHTIFHCVFYHPFIDSQKIQSEIWDLACDVAVEGIISELKMKQLEHSKQSIIDKEINSLTKVMGKLTAEKLYKYLQTVNINEFIRLKKLFSFDQHPWYQEDNQNDNQNNSDNQTDDNEDSGNSESKNQTNQTDENEDSNDSEANNQSNQTNNEQEDVSNSQNPSSNQNDESSSNAVDKELEDEWKEIGERVKVDIETSSMEWGNKSSNLVQNIKEANREKYDYSEFLKKFAVFGEEMIINDDEFDYIFYTYGLQLYKNVPLVEPLEYKDVKKVKEFVIAIDTSGSVQGELVNSFITKTYNVLSQEANFFTKINIHIVQCDDEIKKIDKITNKEEFKKVMQNFELRGFGGTDFRPVFNYVDDLINKNKFENLKGLIYFTDGYGTFPDKKPSYETAFVFIDDSYEQPEIPVWAIKLVLRKDEITED